LKTLPEIDIPPKYIIKHLVSNLHENLYTCDADGDYKIEKKQFFSFKLHKSSPKVKNGKQRFSVPPQLGKTKNGKHFNGKPIKG